MGITIAICDDEKNMREDIQNLVNAYCADCQIDLFESGTALMDSELSYDIYFLDVQMPGTNGMKTAEQIREKRLALSGTESIIIFITAHKEYMADAFDVRAFHYLVKPVDKNKFETVFSRAIEDCIKNKNMANKYILVKSGNTCHKISVSEILYVESQGKKSIIHLKDGTIDYYERMLKLEKELGDSFFRSHRCNIVNLGHISRYNATTIWLSNGDEVMLAQKKFQDFVRTYMAFAKRGGLVHD